MLRTAADLRAGELLASFLRPSELEQWERSGSFWVHTEPGWFRFGTLYDIRYRAARWPWVERRPIADLWAELVVTARACPTALTGVANFRGEAPARLAGASDPVLLRRTLEQAKGRYRSLRRAGRDLDAAYLAYDTAQRVARSTRPAWARPFGRAAGEQIRAFAARHPGERARLEAAHAVVLDTW